MKVKMYTLVGGVTSRHLGVWSNVQRKHTTNGSARKAKSKALKGYVNE